MAPAATDPLTEVRPPHVGHCGWLGVGVDIDPDREEMEGIIADAFRQIAPKTLAARLDD